MPEPIVDENQAGSSAAMRLEPLGKNISQPGQPVSQRLAIRSKGGATSVFGETDGYLAHIVTAVSGDGSEG